VEARIAVEAGGKFRLGSANASSTEAIVAMSSFRRLRTAEQSLRRNSLLPLSAVEGKEGL